VFLLLDEQEHRRSSRKERPMYFKQLVKEDLGCASYLVGCTNVVGGMEAWNEVAWKEAAREGGTR